MIKKVAKKKTPKSKNILKNNEMQKILLENFVSLQKIMTHLSQKFDGLTIQISELLKLFDDSARILVKNEMSKKNEEEGTQKLLQTMISVLDQNKIIAKSLVLMYENLLGTSEEKQSFSEEQQIQRYSAPSPKILTKEKEMVPSNSQKEESSFPFER